MVYLWNLISDDIFYAEHYYQRVDSENKEILKWKRAMKYFMISLFVSKFATKSGWTYGLKIGGIRVILGVTGGRTKGISSIVSWIELIIKWTYFEHHIIFTQFYGSSSIFFEIFYWILFTKICCSYLAKRKAYNETIEKYICEATEWLTIMDDLHDETLDRFAEFINNGLLFYEKLKRDNSDRKLIETIKNMNKIENLKNENQYKYFLQAVSISIRRTENHKEDTQNDKSKKMKKNNKKIN